MSKVKRHISSLNTVSTFLTKGACSHTLCTVLNRAFDHPLPAEEHATDPLAGGILQHGYQCGMLWGSTLAAGAQAHRLYGSGARAETQAVQTAQRLVERFRGRYGHTNCLEMTGLDLQASSAQMVMHFLIRGGAIGCFRMAASFANLAFDEIDTALSGEAGEAPAAPASCSALLAKKLGASEQHTVMLAGLAGGIGLSGGACGALGAAIWFTGMSSLREGAKRLPQKPARALTVIDRFLECTDYEFECPKIAGRTFESVGDHARYLCGGGCSKLIDALAAAVGPEPAPECELAQVG